MGQLLYLEGKSMIMKEKIIVKVQSEGRSGYVNVKINHKKLKWYWEFGAGKYVAYVRIPTKDEWNSIFNDSELDREEIISLVAEEVCNQKCKDCEFDISLDSINIYRKSSQDNSSSDGSI